MRPGRRRHVAGGCNTSQVCDNETSKYTATMTTSETQHRINFGWHVADDELPHAPECDDPLASGQRKRWLRERSFWVLPGFFSAGNFEPLSAASVSLQKSPQ